MKTTRMVKYTVPLPRWVVKRLVAMARSRQLIGRALAREVLTAWVNGGTRE